MKNAKTPLFSRGIFFDGLRRLRLTTVLFAVFLSFSALITPIVSVIEQVSNPHFSYDTLSAVTADAFSHHSLFLLLFVLGAPLVALTLFSFLSSRRESDFYHALPFTRTCLFLSLAASGAFSLFCMILLPTLLSALVYTIFSRFFYLSLAKLFLFSFGCFAGALSVLAACILGLSLTGTRFSSLAVTGMILFLPRLVISMMTATLESTLPMVTPGHVAPLFSSTASYVYGFVSYLFPFFEFPTLSPAVHAYNGSAMLYTLCLSALYTVLALLAFRKRPSETAEKPAPSRRLQTVYRTAVGLFCSLSACSMLFACIVESSVKDSLVGIMIAYLSVLVFYCLYELLTTRRGKAMLRAIPTFSLVLLLNAVLLLTMGGIYRVQIGFTPQKDEIRSISIVADSYAEATDELVFSDYVALKTASLSLDDEESRETVANALADCVKTYRTSKNVFDYERHYGTASDGEDAAYEQINLAIRTKSGTHYRSLYVPKADAARLYAKIAEKEEYRRALTEPPVPIKNTLTLSSSGNAVSFRGETADAVFALFKEEMKGLTADQLSSLSNGGRNLAYFYYATELDGHNINLYIEVTPSLFPRTHTRFLELLADRQLADGTVTAVGAALSHKNAAESYEIFFTVRDGVKTYFAPLSDPSALEKAQSAFSMINFHLPTEGETEVTLSAYFWDENVIDEELLYKEILLVGAVPNERLSAFLDILGLNPIESEK